MGNLEDRFALNNAYIYLQFLSGTFIHRDFLFMLFNNNSNYCFIVFYHCLLITIRITCPCDLYPLTLHLYIVKLGLTGEYIIFALKHRLWVLVRTASLRRF